MEEQDLEAAAKVAAKVAAFDQDQAEWGDDASKLALFWRTLKEAGVPDDLAGPLLINAQVNYYNTDDGNDGFDSSPD
jgi:hypothetical protein